MITCNGKCRKGAVDPECSFHQMRCGQRVDTWIPGKDYPYVAEHIKVPCCRKLGHAGSCSSVIGR